VNGYATGDWGDFFLAAAGATAALSGLIFVALSVNIAPVLEADRQSGENFLTGRALEALVALLNVLAVSIVGLTPNIPRGALAVFILVIAAESGISPVLALRASSSVSTPGPIRPSLAGNDRGIARATGSPGNQREDQRGPV
jgi:hypothetical protein